MIPVSFKQSLNLWIHSVECKSEVKGAILFTIARRCLLGLYQTKVKGIPLKIPKDSQKKVIQKTPLNQFIIDKKR